jgi:CubicO group peptidase (beta-lactamase class C family)
MRCSKASDTDWTSADSSVDVTAGDGAAAPLRICRRTSAACLWTQAGWFYWAVILDLASRRVIGWATRDEARTAVFEYIEVWYNRRYSSLGYPSPVAYELLHEFTPAAYTLCLRNRGQPTGRRCSTIAALHSIPMRRGVVIVALLATASIAVVDPCTAQDPAARLAQIAQSFVDTHGFMGSILVAREGRILLNKGYGSANLEWNIPDAPSTKFRLGSVSKQFIAAGILLLEERGRLRIDDPISKYLPDTPAAWDRITIFNLLTHTSGIPNNTSFPDYQWKSALPTTPDQLVARFRGKPLDFQPGEQWSYSNSGYDLLGYLLEKISGQSYGDFLHKNLFEPLGMRSTGADSQSMIILRRASGYTAGRHGPVNAEYIDMTNGYASGGLYSTTEDLLRWEQALFGGKVLSAASFKKMTTAFKSDYALGLLVQHVNNRTLFSHDGKINGFNTDMLYYPDDNLTVIVLSNVTGDLSDEMAPLLASAARREPFVLPPVRKEIAVPADVLQRYVGMYILSPDFSLSITVDDGQLMVQATDSPTLPLFAESSTKFFLKEVDAQCEFSENKKGEFTGLTLYQGGGVRKGSKQ